MKLDYQQESPNMQGTELLFYGLIFGSIGTGFFIYGRKQRSPVPLVCGLILFAIPYFISNASILAFTGVVLVALPFLFKKYKV